MADNTNNAPNIVMSGRTGTLVIKALERRLGIIPAVTDSETANPESSPRVTVSIDNIPVGFFHNMSQSAAAEKLLRMNPGHPLTTNEILEAFKKSGTRRGKMRSRFSMPRQTR